MRPSSGRRVPAVAGLVLLATLSLLWSCSGSGGGSGSVTTPTNTDGSAIQLAEIAVGRLVDVFGLETQADGSRLLTLVERDVLVSSSIEDERNAGDLVGDDDIQFDFLSPDPTTLQPRLLITREVGSPEFDELFDQLDDGASVVTPAVFGQEDPFPVVPRNGGFRLTFTRTLPVDNSFFYELGDNGQVEGLRNVEAIQLLRIVGNPNDDNLVGDFVPVAARLNVKGNTVVVDPVLLGTEGRQFQAQNSATGLIASPVPLNPGDLQAANIRIAIALDGPLSIPRIREDDTDNFTGLNNSAVRAIVRDMRSGNSEDDNQNLANGFVLDSDTPRILGEMRMLLSRVDLDSSTGNQIIELFKAGLEQTVNRGDVLTFLNPDGSLLGSSEVIEEPQDDTPEAQFVSVRITAVEGLEEIDPSNEPDYPANPRSAEGQRALFAIAPPAVLSAAFSLSAGDNPANFVTFAPSPLANVDGSFGSPTENVSPFASMIVRFSEPVDLDTVRPADTFFVATRNLLSDGPTELDGVVIDEGIDAFRARFIGSGGRLIGERDGFNEAKFRTPHLVSARRLDEDGSQTSVRLEPILGLYLDERMRELANPVGGADPELFHYFVHVLGGASGIRDLSGNGIDLQPPANGVAQDFIVVPFTVDTRFRGTGEPFFADNRVAHSVRTFSDLDEDERPSYYIREEAAPDPAVVEERIKSEPLDDLFGEFTYLTQGPAAGRLEARGTSRIRRVVDDFNQQSPPPQTSDRRWCIEVVPGEFNGEGIASVTGGTPFPGGIQNPLNPFGARFQTIWREIDLSLSRINPDDFNLDVEAMYWGVNRLTSVTFDQFDDVSLFLGHSEFRAEPCIGSFSSLNLLQQSGLNTNFESNWAVNNRVDNSVELRPEPHVAFQNAVLPINAADTTFDPNGVNRFLPLAPFETRDGLFVWRDETLALQGGRVPHFGDLQNAPEARDVEPYMISPWLNGEGRSLRAEGNNVVPVDGFWNFYAETLLGNPNASDGSTGGGLGSIGLPLLAEFQVLPDSTSEPVENPFRASGFNGWQISIAVQSEPEPYFRAFSGGGPGVGGGAPDLVEPGTPEWVTAAGGRAPNGLEVGEPRDNSVYWIMIDFLKRQSVATSGFIELLDPHRVCDEMGVASTEDPRLGPFLFDQGSGPVKQLPAGTAPFFVWALDPPSQNLPAGTAIVPEFRATGRVDPAPWRFTSWRGRTPRARGAMSEAPDPDNFPLDPLKACDAGIRKFDDREVNGGPRNFWVYNYNEQVSDYVRDPNTLTQPAFLARFSSPQETFEPQEIEYVNWRLIMRNNAEAQVPVSPRIDSFMFAYRFERR